MSTGQLSTLDLPGARPAADLPAGACHVWWARPTDAAAAWADVLDAEERARLDALPRRAEHQRFLAAHALCRTVLAAYLGADPAALRFVTRCGACGGPHGKPALAGPSVRLEFSIAGGGDRVAVAVAASPVGVDVEELGRDGDHAALAGMALRSPRSPCSTPSRTSADPRPSSATGRARRPCSRPSASAARARRTDSRYRARTSARAYSPATSTPPP